jgi:hemerythrin-like metal-binding protein
MGRQESRSFGLHYATILTRVPINVLDLSGVIKTSLQKLEAETMTAPIKWKDYYSVGVPSIDAQHKQIIGVINELYEAMQNESAQKVIKPILDRLVKYTFKHFKYEEEALQASGYPDFSRHKALHDKIREETIALQEHADLVTDNNLLHFLKEWWMGHIQSEDKKYKPYLELSVSRK